MPTSTVWRRPPDSSAPRGVSPDPPSAEFVERLSPEPFSPSLILHTSRQRCTTRRNTSSLQGLGLSHTGLLDGTVSSAQPDHLYIDQNGGAHVGSRAASAGGDQASYQNQTSQDRASRQSRFHQDSRRARNKAHTRSGSTIDDLASAAIATSPTFNGESPTSYDFRGSPGRYHSARPATAHLGRFGFHDSNYDIPPAKRVKSEMLPTAEWSPQANRPTTSYLPSVESMNEEAALLLGLRTEVNFKTHISPPAPTPARIHYSPEADSICPELPSTTPSAQQSQEPEQPRKLGDTYEGLENIMPNVDQVKPPISTVASADMPALSPDGLRQVEIEAVGLLPIGSTYEAQGLESDQVKNGHPTQSKKIRRVKPQVQAEVCPECKRLQQETDSDEEATISWICCNGCERWFHAMCAGFKTKAEARSVDKFVCKDCESSHGKTTFVRKSSRARTAIDYAGLNQGLIKSSVDTSMHHYVQPIKDGKIIFLPDDFARIRPETLTAEFMESFDGMKRPFVVPACWNPRFGQSRTVETPTTHADGPEDPCYDSNGNQIEREPIAVDGHPDEETFEMVIDCEQDLLDMVMPRDLTVRKVAELYGPEEPVPVIDVKTQETKGAYTLSQWADYYELLGDKPIRNVISLEVSESRLGRLIRRPKVVRDLDLEDCVWDEELRIANKKRPVQFYCLMSVADSYTDFHIDFGGSSVYYHILKGTKTFFFIPPEDRYLKKYEEWCNSDTQNDTFLGDLCNNNCTRVDLHEGDTAFIPAGWIHAVWTPEDSLVIGGNFLTRLDYDLQLKVANIEKVTKVSPKFRYPFFQKVMWYALLKYLEDDPVPNEVIQEFHDDPDFEFLRANQVWQELGELANNAEPGTGEYHARYYPKAEIVGLPALRDYLYRTARIYADLPVPDINKKQIDAVKASVPKGHGDPLTLIKMFAIWCAWKIGGVPVPEWVHTDAGGLSEFEKKEKVRKPETFRLPGERTSLRKANQANTRDSPEPSLATPNKAVNVGSEVDSDSGKKSRAGVKGTGLRVACEACRKRRIKCRHKECETSPSLGEFTRPRSQSVVSNETSAPIAPLLYHSERPKLGSPDLSLQESNNTSNLAQAALATLDSQQIDLSHTLTNGTLPSSGKKSRSKACEECRKSKRRCVHDEHGRVDPAKAAEPSKPRGSASGKRSARSSDEGTQPKRAKLEFESDENFVAIQRDSIDDLIDPALTNGEFTISVTDDTEMSLKSSLENETNYLHPKMVNGIFEDSMEIDTQQQNPAIQPHSDPMPDEDVGSRSASVKPELDHEQTAQGFDDMNQDLDQGLKPAAELGFASPGYEEPLQPTSDLQLSKISPSSRHSSRQPKQVERYTPEDHRSPTKSQPRTTREERRASSAVSGQTVFTAAKSRRSSSNTSGTTHQIGATVIKRAESQEAAARPGSRDSTAESDVDADAKFARELQAAENGLRRRTSLRA